MARFFLSPADCRLWPRTPRPRACKGYNPSVMEGEEEEEFAYPELQLKKDELAQLQSLMDAIEKGTPLEEWRAPRGWLFYSRSHNGKGDTPLTWAARHGNTEATAWLIEKYSGGLALADEGWLDEHLPGAGGSGLEYTTRAGAGPLMIASAHGSVECARLLLGAGAAVGSANGHGRTPLSAAIKHGQIECARLLVGAGAAVGTTSCNGITPLLTAVKYGHIECARLLLSAGAAVDTAEDSHTALFAACNNGLTECARLLLERGAAVDQATINSGTTPLFAASRYGHVECVRLLLGAGAAVETGRTGGTSTPLDAAIKHDHMECARLLLEAGATVDTGKANGRTSLFTAVRWCYIDCVKLLSSYGACRLVQRGPSVNMTAEAVSRHFHGDTLTEWLVLSRHWSPLHHLEVLTLERARALLQGDADLRLKPAADVPTPLERALPLAPGCAVASLVVRAAGPWSVESHELFSDVNRAQAAMMARSLYHVYLRRMDNGGWQAVDFTRSILSFLIFR